MHHYVYKIYNKKTNIVNLQRVSGHIITNLCINSFELLVKFIILIENKVLNTRYFANLAGICAFGHGN